jgi:hypothetical protein
LDLKPQNPQSEGVRGDIFLASRQRQQDTQYTMPTASQTQNGDGIVNDINRTTSAVSAPGVADDNKDASGPHKRFTYTISSSSNNFIRENTGSSRAFLSPSQISVNWTQNVQSSLSVQSIEWVASGNDVASLALNSLTESRPRGFLSQCECSFVVARYIKPDT